MSGFLYTTRTLHPPLTADGRNIKNNFGVIVATASDPFEAEALVRLANWGVPTAQEQEAAYDKQEEHRMKLVGKAVL